MQYQEMLCDAISYYVTSLVTLWRHWVSSSFCWFIIEIKVTFILYPWMLLAASWLVDNRCCNFRFHLWLVIFVTWFRHMPREFRFYLCRMLLQFKFPFWWRRTRWWRHTRRWGDTFLAFRFVCIRVEKFSCRILAGRISSLVTVNTY